MNSFVVALVILTTAPRFLHRDTPPQALTVGDFEPPDALLLMQSQEWPETIDEIVNALSGRVNVYVVINGSQELGQGRGRDVTDHGAHPGLLHVPHDTAWVRDYGPRFLRDVSGAVTWTDFVYDLGRPDDDAFPERLASLWRVPVARSEIPLEGGALASNGRGYCVMTERSYRVLRAWVPLLSEPALLEAVGCQTLLLVADLPSEPTGHVDLLAQFFSPTLLGVAQLDPRTQPLEASLLNDMARQAQELGARFGAPLDVVRVPMFVSDAAHYSYLNGVTVADLYLMPSYAEVPRELEALALSALEHARPRDSVVPIPADRMALMGGALHCITLGIFSAP